LNLIITILIITSTITVVVILVLLLVAVVRIIAIIENKQSTGCDAELAGQLYKQDDL